MRKTSVHFKLLLDVCLWPTYECLSGCVTCHGPQGWLKEKREFQPPAWLSQHQVYVRRMKAGSSHHSCMMSFITVTGCRRLGERFSSENMVGFTCIVLLLQVRVLCLSSQDVAVEPDNLNQSRDHQEVHSRQ